MLHSTHHHPHPFGKHSDIDTPHTRTHDLFSFNLELVTVSVALVNTILIPQMFSIALAHRHLVLPGSSRSAPGHAP